MWNACTPEVAHTEGVLRSPAAPRHSKRGSKDFPFLAHTVRSDVGRARVSAVLHHALAAHPELCATEAADSLEGLHGVLSRFVRAVVAPRIAGSPTTLVMLSHGGSAMLNVRGRLDGPAILGVGNSGDEYHGRSAVLLPAWLAREVALPLARAAAALPGGRLLWAQNTCFSAPIVEALAAAVTGVTGAEPRSFGRAGSAAAAADSPVAPADSGAAAGSGTPRLAFVADRPAYSKLKDAAVALDGLQVGASGTNPDCSVTTSYVAV